MTEIELFLDKAHRALDAADLLLAEGHNEFAASLSYYAVFYVATALLLTRNLRSNRHRWLLSQYGNEFARTGLLDPAFHRLLRTSFDLRLQAHYSAALVVPRQKVESFLAQGRQFLAAARQYLQTTE